MITVLVSVLCATPQKGRFGKITHAATSQSREWGIISIVQCCIRSAAVHRGKSLCLSGSVDSMRYFSCALLAWLKQHTFDTLIIANVWTSHDWLNYLFYQISLRCLTCNDFIFPVFGSCELQLALSLWHFMSYFLFVGTFIIIFTNMCDMLKDEF